MTPETAPATVTALTFTPAPDPVPDTAPDTRPADPDSAAPAIAAEILTLTADRFAPTDDLLDLITWNTGRITAAYGITDQDALGQVTSSVHAALAFAIVDRYGLAGIEHDGDIDQTATRHLARLTDIPREHHHDLLATAARAQRHGS
jgi:hypothetical protein